LPNKKDALLIFVIGGFVKQSVFTYLRLKMWHNREVNISNNLQKWIKHKSMDFFQERLQVKIVSKSGWWLGSHGRCINPRDLQESLMSMDESKGIPIEWRVKMIRIEKGKKTETTALWAMTSCEKVMLL
jgi:hypothetical protein